ncbi:FapA family protein [Pullulanibacillus sp. KACC 23026]|uniref:FapA family protein n=1 Tax=Pullulanibacillus sp. KACC 23026 TaxID=3028315 RepID=UPI0023B1984D|nr:FapA family protein [Pullulanibacillus sp. KACC 23026]WEG12463.1 FapA family protein [Pullulanibacillus sp. KACC 23026]
MQSIVSRGKNVKEAIGLGLKLLGADSNNVDVEIIQQESKGLWGIGAKRAIVKLSVKSLTVIKAVDLLEQTFNEEGDPHIQNAQLEFEKHEGRITETRNRRGGKVWVKDGQLYWSASPTHYPTVSVCNNVKLLKNGRTVNDSTVVLTDNDSYEIVTTNEEMDTVWNIVLDPNKLSALLVVKPGYKITRNVQDMSPDVHLALIAMENKQVYNSLSFEKIMKRLEFLRIKQGINQQNILNAVQSTEAGNFEIATGIKAKNGQDGWIELKVEIDNTQGLQVDEQGNADFRDSRINSTVDRGDIIAVIHPPVPGKLGLTVTGEPLPPKQTFPIDLKLGKGATLVKDQIVAIESGRPKVIIDGRRVNVSILPKLVHPGAVDLKSGNIQFSGDVEIIGHVKGQIEVEADGDILIQSTVNFATVSSKGAIVVKKNIANSELSAGRNNLTIAECGHMLSGLYQQIDQMNALINQLRNSTAFKQTDLDKRGLQPLIKLLLEKRFKSIVPLAKQYVEVALKDKEQFDSDDWQSIALSLKQIFLSLTNQLITYERLLDITSKMKELLEWSKSPVEPQSFITIFSILNSKLYSSGNVSVIGQGSVNTIIHSGGLIKIYGVVRGGELYGKQGIEINEVGSEMGIRTVLAVPLDQKIKIKKVLGGTVLKIGNIKYTFNEIRYDVEAYLNHSGEIIIN